MSLSLPRRDSAYFGDFGDDILVCNGTRGHTAAKYCDVYFSVCGVMATPFFVASVTASPASMSSAQSPAKGHAPQHNTATPSLTI